MGPPTCGTSTVSIGQTCMSVARAAGNMPSSISRRGLQRKARGILARGILETLWRRPLAMRCAKRIFRELEAPPLAGISGRLDSLRPVLHQRGCRPATLSGSKGRMARLSGGLADDRVRLGGTCSIRVVGLRGATRSTGGTGGGEA